MGTTATRYRSAASWASALGLTLLIAGLLAAASAVAMEPPVLLGAFGPDGTEASNFPSFNVGAMSVAVDEVTGTVLVVDRNHVENEPNSFEPDSLYRFGPNGGPLAFSYGAPYITGNKLTGLTIPFMKGTGQVAINSQTHDFYVTSGGSVKAFHASGEPAAFSAGAAAGTAELVGSSEAVGIAVDKYGDIYVSNFDSPSFAFEPGAMGSISVFAPSGAPITSFETERPGNLAVAPDGTLYVARLWQHIAKLVPTSFPVTNETEYVESSNLSEPESVTSLAVDPTTEDVYAVGGVRWKPPEGVDIIGPPAAPFRAWQISPTGEPITSFAGPEEEGSAAQGFTGIAVRGSTQHVYISYPRPSEHAPDSKVEIFGPPPPAPPTIIRTAAAHVTATSAELRGVIKPNGVDTSYRFEYGTASCSQVPDPCTPVPGGSGDVGAGRPPVSVSADLTGLSPSTTYHFRLVAENALGAAEGERTLTTQGPGGQFNLLDGRGWELVSPAEKHAGEIYPPSLGVAAASESGDGVTFASMGPIDAFPEGSRPPEPSQQLARHGAGGWASEDLDPRYEFASRILLGGAPFRNFSADLKAALVEPQGVGPLSPEASERTPYLRENVAQAPRWRPLVTGKEGYANVAPDTDFGGNALGEAEAPVVVWATTPDLRHVVIRSQVPLLGDGTGASGNFLYEWSEGILAPVSVLPSGLVSAFTDSTGTIFGSISSDGRFAFWGNGTRTALYVRDMQEGETVRLDVAKGVPSPAGQPFPLFQGASSDGRHAFFTDTQQLTPDAGPGTNLYECELVKPTSTTKCILRDLTPQSGAEGAEVQGMGLGIAEDGRSVYFVANGVLAPGAEPGSCREGAKPGSRCNLYVAKREGETWSTTFVASLANKDSSDWGMASSSPQWAAAARDQVATPSPTGRYLVFMSERSLTGYENADVATGQPDQEMFVYDSQGEALHCVSCDPSGAQPQGTVLEETGQPPAVDPRNLWIGLATAAILPDPNVSSDGNYPASYRPRAVHDNGRIFFNAFDALVPADVNGTWDAYEYEPTGVGGCGSEPYGAAVVAADGGCVGLLSSGTSAAEAAVLDSSAGGDDVFLLTRSRLSPRDLDAAADVYDVHVCGAGWPCPAAEPSPPAPCDSGAACRSPGEAEEEEQPASALLGGTGNLAHHHRKKHHHKRRARKHHKHAHRRHGGAK